MSNIDDIKQGVANAFYEQMRQGQSFLDYRSEPGQTPFAHVGGWPVGPTGNMYRDWKALQFLVTSTEHNMDHPVWLNSEQCSRNGYYIQKGQTSHARVERQYEEGKTIVVPMFNGSQVRGLPHPQGIELTQAQREDRNNAIINAFLQKQEPNITFDEMAAPYYDSINDMINIAPRGAYERSPERGDYDQDMFRLIAEAAATRSNVLVYDKNDAEGQYLKMLREELVAAQVASELRIGYRPEHQYANLGGFLAEHRPSVERLQEVVTDANTIYRAMNIPSLERQPIPARPARVSSIAPATEEMAPQPKQEQEQPQKQAQAKGRARSKNQEMTM